MAKPDWTKFRGYWNLDEAGGSNAIDSTANGNELVETLGTIESTEGGRDLELGETEYFAIADNASLSFADVEMTFGIWGKLESQATTQYIMSKYDRGIDQRAYALVYVTGADRYVLYIDDNGTGATSVTANNYGAVPATTKAFIMGWHDPVANKIYISVNNGAANEAAHAGGILDNTAPFAIGTTFDNTAAELWLDGIVWSGFVYAGLMTAGEKTWLYNAGVPRKWSEIYFVPKAIMI